MIVRSIKNLTPHRVVIYDTCGTHVKAVYESCGVARVRSEGTKVGIMYGIPVTKIRGNIVEGLPEKEEGTVYIVSSYVAATLKETRDDLVAPDMSTAIYDENKEVLGVRKFVTYSDNDFEISNVASFQSVYRKTNICKRLKFPELNALYIYYKQIVCAGGEWPDLEEVDQWNYYTIDDLACILKDRDKLNTDLSINQQNEIVIAWLYSHAEVVLNVGRSFVVKSLKCN